MEYLNFYFQMAILQEYRGYVLVGELAKITKDVSKSKRHYILSRLINAGYITRLKRGVYAVKPTYATMAISAINDSDKFDEYHNVA